MKLETIITVMFFVFVIFGVGALFVIYGQGGRCMVNPLGYGTKEYTKENNAELICSCSFNNTMQPFFVNSSGLNYYPLKPSEYFDSSSVDLKSLEIFGKDNNTSQKRN